MNLIRFILRHSLCMRCTSAARIAQYTTMTERYEYKTGWKKVVPPGVIPFQREKEKVVQLERSFFFGLFVRAFFLEMRPVGNYSSILGGNKRDEAQLACLEKATASEESRRSTPEDCSRYCELRLKAFLNHSTQKETHILSWFSSYFFRFSLSDK